MELKDGGDERRACLHAYRGQSVNPLSYDIVYVCVRM